MKLLFILLIYVMLFSNYTVMFTHTEIIIQKLHNNGNLETWIFSRTWPVVLTGHVIIGVPVIDLGQ